MKYNDNNFTIYSLLLEERLAELAYDSTDHELLERFSYKIDISVNVNTAQCFNYTQFVDKKNKEIEDGNTR